MIKACLFDLDGVIVDTAKYHYLAWKSLADELDIDFTIQDNERLKGVIRMQSLDIILEIGNKTIEESQKLKLAETKNNRYVEYIQQLQPNEILPNAEVFLRLLKSNGICSGIGSASKNTTSILSRLAITGLFDAIVDGNIASEAKPSPQVFLMGAEALHVLPQQCIVFEDSFAGIEAANAGGMLSVGVGEKAVLHNARFHIKGFYGDDFKKLCKDELDILVNF